METIYIQQSNSTKLKVNVFNGLNNNFQHFTFLEYLSNFHSKQLPKEFDF